MPNGTTCERRILYLHTVSASTPQKRKSNFRRSFKPFVHWAFGYSISPSIVHCWTICMSNSPRCSRCLCGCCNLAFFNHRDTENTEVAQRKHMDHQKNKWGCRFITRTPHLIVKNPRVSYRNRAWSRWLWSNSHFPSNSQLDMRSSLPDLQR